MDKNSKEYKNQLEFSDERNFICYAMAECGMTEGQASVEWRNAHYKFKYVLCESRDDYKDGRMFIRTLTDTLTDTDNKQGWWNTFTLSTKVVPTGIYLCQIKEYKLDRNGYLNLLVSPLVEVPKLKLKCMFSSSNGTWNSTAVHLMLVGCRKFLPEYSFREYRSGNIKAFLEKFPQYAEIDDYSYMCNVVLMDWLSGDIELKDIEDALNTPTDFEALIKKVQKAVARGTIADEFPEYPNFAKKIALSENSESHFMEGYIGYQEVEDYIERNVDSYERMVKEGVLEKVESDFPLDKIEAMLEYRRQLKKQARLERKQKKKENK